jgi:hypothetical protein
MFNGLIQHTRTVEFERFEARFIEVRPYLQATLAQLSRFQRNKRLINHDESPD